MASYSLIDERWIPVRFTDGTPSEVGLRLALQQAHEICEIEAGTPPVTAALNRLLLAVSMDAIDTDDEDAWLALWDTGRFDPAAVDTYFDNRQDQFDLLHPNRPFFQDARLRNAQTKAKGNPTLKVDPLSKLFLDEHTNAILFNHAYIPRTLPLAEAARGIVGAQMASPSDGRSAQIKGEGTIRGKSPAMLLNKTMFWLRGAPPHETLFQALLLNAPPEDFRMPGSSDNAPAWELGPPGASDSGGRAPRGPLDYLTWQVRRLLLEIEEKDGSKFIAVGVKVVQGAKLPKVVLDDPLLAYVAQGGKGLVPYQVRPDRALWRDITTVLAPLEAGKGENIPPRIIEWARDQRDQLGLGVEWRLDAFFVRNEPGPGGAGKIDFWRHERMPLHLGLLAHKRLLSLIERALRYADYDVRGADRGVIQQLRDATLRFARYVRFDPSYELNRNDWDDARALAQSLEAEPRFWARLEEPFFEFLAALADLTQLAPNEAEAAAVPALNQWKSKVRRAARRAFAGAVAAFGSDARTLRALAEAETVLYPAVQPEISDSPDDQPKEVVA